MSAVRVWVDADACPNGIKDILFRAALRTGTETILVANQAVRVPGHAYVRAVQVPQGFDIADNYIVQHIAAGELVVTADIPLAAEAMAKGAFALNPRGEMYSHDTIRQRLNLRDFMDSMRASGAHTGGPAPMNIRDKQAFANALDGFLARAR